MARKLEVLPPTTPFVRLHYLIVVMLVLNAGPKDLVVQLTIHPIVLKKLS